MIPAISSGERGPRYCPLLAHSRFSCESRSPLGILLGVLGSSGSSSDVNPYHRRCRGRDVRDAVMGGVVRGSGGGFIIAGGGGSPPNMVVDGDLGSGGVGDVVVVGGHCGVLVIGGGGR
ncbi:hypothetical protein Tco_0824522 [Tanacetum coccineum]|uniref:Uncharacterized protein n=1 Tax=Tanacetum coccineum TaxID=301880 RepID=A0ABQ5ALX5_9ASTR